MRVNEAANWTKRNNDSMIVVRDGFWFIIKASVVMGWWMPPTIRVFGNRTSALSRRCWKNLSVGWKTGTPICCHIRQQGGSHGTNIETALFLWVHRGSGTVLVVSGDLNVAKSGRGYCFSPRRWASDCPAIGREVAGLRKSICCLFGSRAPASASNWQKLGLKRKS